jgi:predicted AAA+ superfamily ATPase
MKRRISAQLRLWKDAVPRKPLIVRGPRQVGKTFSLKEFGQGHFPETHYANFEKEPRLRDLFRDDLRPERILKDLSFHFDRTIAPGKDLLILDEIQECPPALTAFKYFAE